MATDDPADSVLLAVGRRIGEIRRDAGLTQEQAAERLGISVRAYGYIESGRENLTLRTMVGVSAVLGVELSDLLVPPQSSEATRGRPRKRVSEAPKAPEKIEMGADAVTRAKPGRSTKPRSSRS